MRNMICIIQCNYPVIRKWQTNGSDVGICIKVDGLLESQHSKVLNWNWIISIIRMFNNLVHAGNKTIRLVVIKGVMLSKYYL